MDEITALWLIASQQEWKGGRGGKGHGAGINAEHRCGKHRGAAIR